MNNLLTKEDMLENNITRLITCKYRLMMKYQEDNNIKSMCIINTLYWFNQMRPHELKLKVVATLVISHSPFTQDGIRYDKCFINHLILLYDDGTVCDVSHEIKSLVNKEYFDNIKCFIDAYGTALKENTKVSNYFLPHLIREHIKMVDIADKINNNKPLSLGSNLKEYHDSLVSYIKSNLTLP